MTATYALLRRNHGYCHTMACQHERDGNYAEHAIWRGRMLDFAHQMAAEEQRVPRIPVIPDTARRVVS